MEKFKKKCHSGSVAVFKDPESKIIFNGGGSMRGMTVPRESFVIDVGCEVLEMNCTNIAISKGLSEQFVKKVNKMQDLNLKGILIDWKDGDVIAFKGDFWNLLIQEIRFQKRNVYVGCVGGHGRTGTVLAIFAGLLGVTKDPISFIRKSYCINAVETFSQVKYIEEITGLVSSEGVKESLYFTHFSKGKEYDK